MVALRTGDASSAIRDIEAAAAVTSHELCGAVIFKAWNLPEALIAATRHHHDPMAAPEMHRDLAALVHLGAHVALAAGYTFALEPGPGAIDPAALTWLGLEDSALPAVSAELAERVAALDQALAGA